MQVMALRDEERQEILELKQMNTALRKHIERLKEDEKALESNVERLQVRRDLSIPTLLAHRTHLHTVNSSVERG